MIEPAPRKFTNKLILSITDTQFLKKGCSINSVYITAKPKTASKTAKTAILAFLSKNRRNPYQHRKNSLKTQMSDLQHRASKITGLIMSNRLSDRFKQGDESIMQMMARIQNEITNRCNSRPMRINWGIWRSFLRFQNSKIYCHRAILKKLSLQYSFFLIVTEQY